jgi:Reverse transcriptase (RNA-dependent DNA polymerase)
MDYRRLNKWMIRDNNPLPNITTAMERLHGKMLFSKFDIHMGYNNIYIDEKDQYKAAIKTQFGTYIPCIMYFGLTNTPPFFQQTMHRDFRLLLQKYPENIGNYMDDWWIATANDKEGRKLHTQIIHEFLDLMEEKSYFLKPKKCQFEKDSMEILGWLVGGGKIQIDPAKVKGISEWPRELKNKEEVRCTLGVLGYQ